MAKKAKYNISIGGINYEKGKIYSDEETKDLDMTNFDDVTDEGAEIASGADLDSQEEQKKPDEEQKIEEKQETDTDKEDDEAAANTDGAEKKGADGEVISPEGANDEIKKTDGDILE